MQYRYEGSLFVLHITIGTTHAGYGTILHDRVAECLPHADATVTRNDITWVDVEWKSGMDAFARAIVPLVTEDLRLFLLMERIAENQVLTWLEACQDIRPKQQRWKAMAATRIADHIATMQHEYRETVILLEGFVRFRMQDWLKELDQVAGDAISLVQRKDMIASQALALKEWLDQQPIGFEEIRVMHNNGRLTLGSDHAIQGLERLDKLYREQGVGVEERLVGILMGLVPRRVLWCGSSDELRRLPLLNMVFGDRIRSV